MHHAKTAHILHDIVMDSTNISMYRYRGSITRPLVVRVEETIRSYKGSWENLMTIQPQAVSPWVLPVTHIDLSLARFAQTPPQT